MTVTLDTTNGDIHAPADEASMWRALHPERRALDLLGVQSIDDLGTLLGKKVFLRIDVNVSPTSPHFAIHPRTKQSVATLEKLLGMGARVVVASHHSASGEGHRYEQSKRELVEKLQDTFPQLAASCSFIPIPDRCKDGRRNEILYFRQVEKKLSRMGAGEAVFLENIRMLDFELETRDPHVEERIANTFDYIVHDGFGVAHRSGQFSVDGILSCVETDRKALGPASATEWSNLFRFVESASAGSMAVVIGGDVDKFDTKLWLLQDLLKSGKVGLVYLGGVFGTTYLHSVGEGMGKTPISRNHGHQQILARLPEQYPNVLFKLPRCYVGLGPDKAARAWNVETNEHTRRPSLTVEPDSLALDQEPEDFITLLERHHMTSVLAVGPLGYYSHPAFKQGTLQSYQNLATWALRGDSRQLLVGGGNSIDALLELSCFSHPSSDAIMISAGGGALLDAVAEVLRATETNTPVHTSVVRALREAPRSRSSLYNMLGSAENITI